MATTASNVGGMPTQQLTADEVLTTTRTLRKRLDLTRAVPRELIEECIQVARCAPTGGNSQQDQFVVVTDAARKQALAEIYMRAWNVYKTMPRAEYADPKHASQQPQVFDSAQYLADHMAEVPVLVIPCITPKLDTLPLWVQAVFWGSIMPQAWSFMLAARARGLGVAFTTLHNMYEAEAAAVLGIPHEKYTQAAMLAVAYSKGSTFTQAYREPAERFIHWNVW